MSALAIMMIVGCGGLALSVAFAAVLWWAPHYQVIPPTDKRVILDATPTLTVQVKNHGLFGGTYSGAYALDGIQQSDVQIPLSPGQVHSIELKVPVTTPRGPHTLSLGAAQISAVALLPAKFHVTGLLVDAPVAKIGQDVSVSASVQNTGDIAGVFPGAMDANGQCADTQPTNVAPGQSRPLDFTLTRTSAGRCRLKIGDASVTVMVVKPIRLANGHTLRNTVSGGSASLTITNPLTSDAMVLLTRVGSLRTPVLAVYVRAKHKTTVNNVSDGRYVAWDCIGADWNSYTRDFLTTLLRHRWRTPLVFSTSSSTSYWNTYSSDAWYIYTWQHSQTHTSWTNWTLTLGSRAGKNAVSVSSRQFPKMGRGGLG